MARTDDRILLFCLTSVRVFTLDLAILHLLSFKLYVIQPFCSKLVLQNMVTYFLDFSYRISCKEPKLNVSYVSEKFPLQSCVNVCQLLCLATYDWLYKLHLKLMFAVHRLD